MFGVWSEHVGWEGWVWLVSRAVVLFSPLLASLGRRKEHYNLNAQLKAVK